jgi:hypothetical protein
MLLQCLCDTLQLVKYEQQEYLNVKQMVDWLHASYA